MSREDENEKEPKRFEGYKLDAWNGLDGLYDGVIKVFNGSDEWDAWMHGNTPSKLLNFSLFLSFNLYL